VAISVVWHLHSDPTRRQDSGVNLLFGFLFIVPCLMATPFTTAASLTDCGGPTLVLSEPPVIPELPLSDSRTPPSSSSSSSGSLCPHRGHCAKHCLMGAVTGFGRGWVLLFVTCSNPYTLRDALVWSRTGGMEAASTRTRTGNNGSDP
jgi:hypothetical protein